MIYHSQIIISYKDLSTKQDIVGSAVLFCFNVVNLVDLFAIRKYISYKYVLKNIIYLCQNELIRSNHIFQHVSSMCFYLLDYYRSCYGTSRTRNRKYESTSGIVYVIFSIKLVINCLCTSLVKNSEKSLLFLLNQC